MARVFNPPPGWPKPPEDWTPPPGWKPDPNWPEPPRGWDFWIEKADDVGSTLFGGSALGSSLFDTSESSTDSYGSVSPSGEAHIPGAPTGPNFTVSNQEPASLSEGTQQSTAAAPSSPSGNAYPTPPGNAYSGSSYSGDPYATGGAQSAAGGPTRAGTAPEGVQASTFSPAQTPGGNPNSPAPLAPQGGGRLVLFGLLLIAVGVGATVFGFVSGDGGQVRIWWGPALVGLILVIQGIVRLLRAAAQRRHPMAQMGTGYDPSNQVTQPGGGAGAAGGLQTGQSSTLPTQNPTDPNNYRR